MIKCKKCGNDFGSEDLDGFCAVCVLENELEKTNIELKLINEMLNEPPAPKKSLSFLEQKTKSYLSQWKWMTDNEED